MRKIIVKGNIIPKNQFFRVLFGIKNQTIVFQESPFLKGGCFLDKEQALFICSVANIQI